MPEGQKRAPDLITDVYKPPCGCGDLNSGPLKEQTVLLTSEPSLQLPVFLPSQPQLPKVCCLFVFPEFDSLKDPHILNPRTWNVTLHSKRDFAEKRPFSLK